MKRVRKKMESKQFDFNRIRPAIIIGLLFAGLTFSPAFAATSVSKNGITWNFGANYQTGQYVNGDWWVLDSGSGVQVASVSPSPSGSSNGSVINPMGGTSQGYDGRIDGYSASLSVSFPRNLSAGQSLVSTQSRSVSSNSSDLLGAAVQPDHCYLQRAAVLTVVSSVPNANSFRPPYVGSNKATYLTTSLNRNLLLKLPLSGKPAASYVTEVAGYFKEVWLDHKPGWTARMMHPISNMPNYGREIGIASSRAACLILLDYTPEQLEPLLINFVQTGIDLYHMSLLSNNWYGDGGHANGRKWPILFAGIMLNNSAMKSVNRNFGEDDQTYYGSTQSANSGQSNVAYWGRNCSSSYTTSCSGSGTKDCKPSSSSGDGCQDYRNCCTSYTWVGYALAAQLMGQDGTWNHGAFFDYVDRWMGYGNDPRVGSGDWVQPGETGTAFIATMWKTYRSSVGGITPPPPPANIAPIANAGADQTVIDVDGDGSQDAVLNGSASSDSDGQVVSFEWIDGGKTIATGANPTVNLSVGTHTITLGVTDNGGSKDDDAVVITVQAKPITDTIPPAVKSIVCDGNNVVVLFNEELSSAVAQTISNYTIDNSVSITKAVYDNTNKTVKLNTSAHNEFEVYTLTLKNIRDLNNNVMSLTSEKYTYSPGLAGYWEFSETGGNTANDFSGLKNNGSLINGPVWTGADQLKFDGINDAVQIPLSGCSFNKGTIALQAYFTNNQNIQYLFGHTIGTWSNRIQLYVNGGYLCAGLGGNHSSSVNIAAIDLNKWYHIALTWDGTNYSVYVDGSKAVGGTYSGLTSLNTVADIGNDASVARNETLNGMIDKCLVYNRCLSSDEILTLCNVDKPFAFNPIGDKQVAEGSLLSFAVNVIDPNIKVSLTDHNLPSAPSFLNNVFNWTPSYDTAGKYDCTFEAEYGMLEDAETITITVNGGNRKPELTPIGNKSVNEGQALTFTVNYSDPDSDAVSCAASNLPAGAAFDGRTFQWTPTSTQAGSYSVQFTASDGSLTDTETITITVSDVPGGEDNVTIVDNSSANTSYTGWWDVSGGTSPYGTNSLWSRDGCTYTWKFRPSVTGTYDVSMWWSGWYSRTKSAPVVITNSGRTATVTVNQSINSGKWNSLGQYKFTAGVNYTVKITAQRGSTVSTCADAVKFALVK